MKKNPKFSKNLFPVFLGVLPIISCSDMATKRFAERTLKDQTKPNLILIVSDDMGYADLGITGSKDMITPRIDQLASEGTLFTDAYVTSPICVPSRAGLFTGRHQARWGIYHNNDGYHPEGQRLTAGEVKFPELLKESGYKTALFGKWHLSGNMVEQHLPESMPERNGFDKVEMIAGGMDSFWEGTPLYRAGGETIKAPEYLTDHFGNLAVDYIRRNKEKPFFLALTFTTPHAPLHAIEKDIESAGGFDGYDHSKYENELQPADRETKIDRRVYRAMQIALDRNIGKVLDALDEMGLKEKTLLVFINDNGGPSHDAAVHSYNTADNGIFRGHKFYVWEGGIRVPMIFRWPGHVPSGNRYSGLASSMDIAATFLHAAGIDVHPERPLDGVNLLPYLNGIKTGDPHPFLAWECTWFRNPDAALRSGEWKIIQTGSPAGITADKWQLYNLARDPGEKNDLSAVLPEKVTELNLLYQEWRREMAESPWRPRNQP